MRLKSIDLFAGAGGLSLGLEPYFEVQLLVEFNKDAANTLKQNRPEWNVQFEDISKIDFTEYADKGIHLVTGGFPCQAFSYAGQRRGMEDVRGTLFYEFARCISEVKPTAFLAENVRGLITHDNGRTLSTIIETFEAQGYVVYTPVFLNANDYGVAQKRERLFIFGVQKHLAPQVVFGVPPEETYKPVLRDVLEGGDSKPGIAYSERKAAYFEKVPAGGNWRSLAVEDQKAYMGNTYYSGGGRTGLLRRLSWDKPSPTLTTSPSQNLTEFCHPNETRPLSVREYARVQSFPDSWKFCGQVASQYKQIGNAVAVKMAEHLGRFIHEKLSKVKCHIELVR